MLAADGLARSIGVCNFTEDTCTTVIDLTFVTPAVNQIELHPLLNQAELRAANAEHDVVTEAYSPLAVGRLLDNPTVTSIAAEYGRTPAQVLIRWSLQLGNVVISRSANPERIAEQHRRLRLRVGRRAHGRAQRAQRRHPGTPGSGDLRRARSRSRSSPAGQRGGGLTQHVGRSLSIGNW